MAEKLIVIGASTPTIIRVIDDINRAGDREIELVGFVDNAYEKLGKEFFNFEILGGFEAIQKFAPHEVLLINTIASTTASRATTTDFFLSRGYHFTNIVHPATNMGYVQIGTGNLIYENAMIQPFVRIANHCVISSNTGIAHECSIMDYCFIGPAAYICGKVDIAERVYIGTGAKVLPRLKIGKNAIIGACSLVTESVSDGQKLTGIPAKV